MQTTKFKGNNAVQVDISLSGVTGPLIVPLKITVPVPSGVSPQNFVILHYRNDDTYDEITPKLNGDGTCSFIVTHFSVFVFANRVDPPAPPQSSGSFVYTPLPDFSRPAVVIPSTPAKTYAVNVNKPDGAASAATVEVPVTVRANGNATFSVTSAMVTPGISKARTYLSKLSKAERADGATVEIVPTSAKEIKGMTVRLDKTILTKLAAADMGLGIYSEASFIELDNAAVKELVEQEITTFTFSARPVVRASDSQLALSGGHTLYNVAFRNAHRQDIAAPESGAVTFGLSHEPEDGEDPDTLRLARISTYKAEIMEGSFQEDNWIKWSGSANGLFSVGVEETAPPVTE